MGRTKTLLFSVVFFVLLATVGLAASAAPLIVLVPGFFNSAIPSDAPYPCFSRVVVDTIASQAHAKVVVVDTLSPLGSIEENAAILTTYLLNLIAQNPNQKLTLITHSAGGLYALKMLTDRPDLPVQTVLTIATPYTGVAFLDMLDAGVPGFLELEHYLDLDNLQQFRRTVIAEILPQLSVPVGVRWVAIAGHSPPCHLFDCGSINRLSWLLSITGKLSGRPSDGVVTVDSALAKGLQLRHSDGQMFTPETWDDFNFNLEHWEMVGDSRYFGWLGIKQSQVEARQRLMFTSILSRLQLTDDPSAPLQPTPSALPGAEMDSGGRLSSR